jgi:hypothetical protein
MSAQEDPMKTTLFTIGSLLLLAGSAAAQNEPPAGAPAHNMAIGATFNAVESSSQAHVLKALAGGNYVDIGAGVDFANVSPKNGDSKSVFELDVFAGYRMYKDVQGRIHPYVEPVLSLGVSTDEAMGEPKKIGLAGLLGVDFLLLDQFTLGAAVGGGFNYITAQNGSILNFGLFTSSVNATFWFN